MGVMFSGNGSLVWEGGRVPQASCSLEKATHPASGRPARSGLLLHLLSDRSLCSARRRELEQVGFVREEGRWEQPGKTK